MAQLPPKFPSNISTIPPNSWPRLPSMSSYFLSSSPNSSSSSWVDEFFDFSSSKRGSHRRAMSDSIAFFESVSSPPDASHAVASLPNFDRLIDDEQLMSMFISDHHAALHLHPPSSAPPSTAPSTPSDHNSISDQDRQTAPNSSGNDQSEAQSTACDDEPPLPAAGMSPAPKTPQPVVDPKRVKRILANRQSAQRSRVRKLQYISELERSVTTLETEVSALSPRVAFLDHQRSVLSVGNSHLKQRIAALAQDKIFKDAHQEALQNELERLRHVYHQQSLKKMAAVTGVQSNGAAVAAGKKELNIPAGIDHDPICEC